MSSLPLTVLRPLAFPSHGWVAVLCLRTGRVLTLVSTAETSKAGNGVRPSHPACFYPDLAVSAQTRAPLPFLAPSNSRRVRQSHSPLSL